MFKSKIKILGWLNRIVVGMMVIVLLWPPHIFARQIPQVLPNHIFTTTQPTTPVLLKGMRLNFENPMQFEFIIDTNETDLPEDDLKQEASKLIKYFFAALTVPDDDLWVNLSPYEANRIIPDALGNTELGRDLLAQDYILKQMMASLLYPEGEFGKKFWKRIYEQAHHIYGTTQIPVDTFNKVWIVPDKAVVYSSNDLVYVIENHFKVMLESDYVAMDFQQKSTATSRDPSRGLALKHNSVGNADLRSLQDVSLETSEQIIREIIIPAIEKEVNEGQHFATLRQIGSSMMLGAWYKKNLRKTILARLYVDQNKIEGVHTEEKDAARKIYNQYIDTFKKGIFDYIKEEYDPYTEELIPRKYFSGGAKVNYDEVITETDNRHRLNSAVASGLGNSKTGLYSVYVTSSPVTEKSDDPWTFVDLQTILDDPDKREYGDKTVLLAQFLEFLEENNISFAGRELSDIVPELFLISLKQAMSMSKGKIFSSAERQGLESSLRSIGENKNLTFGDAKRPLLISVRAAPDEITPGQFLSVLNVGINDETVEGLVDEFRNRGLAPQNARIIAYSLYAKLIEDFLAEVPNESGEKFPRRKIRKAFSSGQFLQQSGFDSLEEYDVHPWEKVRVLKILYQQHFQGEFSQDVYQQLHMVINAIPLVAHYAFDEGDTRNHPVIIQRMVFGSLVNGDFSGAGELKSRDPVSGDRILSGNLEKGKQGDTTTGLTKILGLNDLDQLEDHVVDFYDEILRLGELFLKGTARIETTIEQGVPYLLQIRRMERNEEADVKALWELLSFWREDERQGIPVGDRRGLSPDKVLERGKQYLTAHSLRKQQRLEDTSGLIPLGTGITVSQGAASARMVMSPRGASRFVASHAGQDRQNDDFILFQHEIRADARPALEHSSSKGAVALEQIGAHVESLTRSANIPGLVGIEPADRFTEIIFDYDTRIVTFVDASGAHVTLQEGIDDISIGEDGVIYKGRTGVISENKPEGMSKRAAQLIIYLLERQKQEPVITIEVHAWNRTKTEIWTANQFRINLDTINNPEHRAWNKEVPLYGPIVDVSAGGSLRTEALRVKTAEVLETREVLDEAIDVAAKHVIREAQNDSLRGEQVNSQQLNDFIYWMWYYYDRLSQIDHNYRQKQLGEEETPFIPSTIRYQNLEEARFKYFLLVLEGAEDVLARSIFHWVQRHKVGAFTFKKGIFPKLNFWQAQRLFGKMVKYGIQEGSYTAVDYILIRIMAEMIKYDHVTHATMAADLINGLERTDITVRRQSNPREFKTISVSAREQRGWLLAGLHALYSRRKLQQRTRSSDLPTVDEVSQFLNGLVVGHESDFSIAQEKYAFTVDGILDWFEQGGETTSSPVADSNNLGGIDLRPYDMLLEDVSGTFQTISEDIYFDSNRVFYGISPQIDSITPITNLRFFYSK